MRAADLDLRSLLSTAEHGDLRFAGERVLLLDATALGILRSELIRTLGVNAARGFLTRFGFVHGWRTAESLKRAFHFDDDAEWRAAGAALHSMQGLVTAERSERPANGALAESIWRDSYEAEQHQLHFGQAEEPVCWSLCGFASGYLSYCYGRDIYFIEDRCAGKGDAVCHVVGRGAEEWGEALAAHLPYFKTPCLEKMMAATAERLKQYERKLSARRKEMHRDGEVVERGGLVVASEAMRRLVEQARRVARVDSTVLITGESGTGKERMARLIHQESARVAGPFVAINCAAMPEALLESELFGHARGAFTGASSDKPGLFEAASGGTLLLDEIGEMAPAMQAKLLRVLQEREVRRVGENRSRAVNVRVLAATNRDLAREVEEGRFRQDLYYRLRVIELRVPPLRERRDDILPLARLFLSETAQRVGRRVSSFSARAADQLVRYPWPGNVRELANAVERALVLTAGSRVEVDELPEEVRVALPDAAPAGRVKSLDEMERKYILAVLEQNGGNQTKTAAQLRIGTATLYRKLKQYRVG